MLNIESRLFIFNNFAVNFNLLTLRNIIILPLLLQIFLATLLRCFNAITIKPDTLQVCYLTDAMRYCFAARFNLYKQYKLLRLLEETCHF